MKNDFKVGILFTMLGQYSTVIVQLIINMILSRMLPVSDFGIVGIVQILIFFFQIVAGQAISPAIIQNKALNSRDYGTIFNYSIVWGGLLAIVFGFSGFLLKAIYDNSIFVPLSWCMSILAVADAVSSVPNGILAKEKRFKAISLRLIISQIIGAAFGVFSVFMGAGIYSLVISATVPAIISLILNLLVVDISYTWSFDFKPIKKIFFFFKNQASFSVINYLYRNLDNLLVGKFLGATSLGFYQKSYQLLSLPVTVFLGIINPVMQPILSEHEANVTLIKETYLRVSKILGFIGISISVFMGLNADKIIYFLFGYQWTGAILPLALLSISIWAQMLASVIGAIWQSRNMPHFQTRNGLISFVIIATAIILGIFSHSLSGVAIAVSISYILNFIVSAEMLLRKGLESKFIVILNSLIKPFLLGIVLVVCLLIIQPYLTFSSLFLTLLSRGLVWMGIVFVFLIISKEMKDIVKFIKK